MAILMSLHDDQYGRGSRLAFPTMSSCVAIILVTPTNLVGLHKTIDSPIGSVHDNRHIALFNSTLAALQGQPIQQLYLVGFMANHNVQQIKTRLGMPNMQAMAYDLARKVASLEWCTFATFQGAAAPRIEIKRSAKVTVSQLPPTPGINSNVFIRAGKNEDIVASNLHELRTHFYQV